MNVEMNFTHMKKEGSGTEVYIKRFFTETRLPCSSRFGKNRLIKFMSQNTSSYMCVTQTV